MLKNIIYLFGMQGVNYLIPLIVLPYLVRVLGPQEYGRLGFSVAIIQYLVLLIDFGFNLLSSSRIAKNKNNLSIVSRIYSITILSKLAISLFIISITIILVFSFPKLYDIRFLLLVSLIQIWGAIFTPNWFFQGMEIMRNFAVISVIARLLSLPLIFIFVKSKDDVIIAAFLQSFVFALSGFIAFIMIHRMKVKMLYVKFSVIKKYLMRSFTIFIGTVAISLYTLSTTIILGMVSNHYELGIFNAADKIRAALLGLFVLMGSVFYPRVNNLLKYDKVRAFRLLKNILLYQSFVTLLLAFIFYYCAPLIVHYYLGEEFNECIDILRLMAPMVVLVPASIVMSNYILLPLGYRKFFSFIPVTTAICHLFYAIYFSSRMGAYGASLAILITEALSFTLLLLVNIKLKNFNKIFGVGCAR
ncbi:TPA: oligosaccharide flippase family protein [Enterobacter hormaechei subsp. steigerwaltii]|nr:oligosaccharide flippase family protein [Enterobacter hormaechei subsp. steigerwaltii]